MTKEKDDTSNQLDLGLTQILESLSGESSSSVPSSSWAPSEPAPLEEEPEVLDPRVTSVADALSSQSIPIVLLVPQVLELFYGAPDLSIASKAKSVECAVEVTKILLSQDETLLAESVLSAVRKEKLSQKSTDELIAALKIHLESNKDANVGFSSEDPKLLSARLLLLDHLRALEGTKPKPLPEIHSEPLQFDFSTTAHPHKSEPRKLHGSRWSWLIILGALLITLYSIYLNQTPMEYEMADSIPTKSKDNTYGSLISESSIQRQDVSNLSALMYDVSREPPTPSVPQATATPANAPVVSAGNQKGILDMSGPIEPPRVQALMDKRNSSEYERPLERDDRGPRLSDERPVERLPDRRPRDLDRPGRFETGERYEVMINTSVMAAPSFNAKEVEELYVGDRVRVEARLGRWLKIRSRDGNPGYILAGDAEKLFD